jgi:tryptophan 2,3-dioxygenase
LQKGKVYREGPLRPGRRGPFPLQLTKTKSVRRTHLKRPHITNMMKVDEVRVSSCFAVSIATLQRTSDLLRNDPNLGKHMVKRGKESPLRQSVTLRLSSGFEQEIQYMEENREWDIEDLKQEIVKFERKNFACRTRHKAPSHPRSKISQMCGR